MAFKDAVPADRPAPSILAERGSRAWFLWAIALLAAFFRFVCLSRKSIYLDEALSVAYAHMSWHEFVQVLSTRDANMAFYYFLLRGVVLLGDSEFWVRLLSVAAGVATVPVMYVLGAKIYGRRTGLLAALLLSVNACHVVYSQEARGYALALLLIALSSWLFIEGIESPSWKTWFLYALISALAVHSHFYAGLVLVAQWLSLLVLPRRMIPVKHVFGAIAIAGILIVPAVLFVLLHPQGHINWLPGISWLEVYHTAVFLAADGGKVPGNVLLGFCLIAFAMTAREFWRGPAQPPLQRWKNLFPWFWLLAPMILTAIGSLWTPMFFHRFLIVCLPGFVLLVARGLTQLRPRSVWIAVFVILAVVTVIMSYSRAREDWRSATQYVLSQAQTGDAIWFYRGYCNTPFLYYERRSSGINPREIAETNVPHVPVLPKATRLWVVFYPVSVPDVLDVEAQLARRYNVVQQSTFRGVRVVLFSGQ